MSTRSYEEPVQPFAYHAENTRINQILIENGHAPTRANRRRFQRHAEKAYKRALKAATQVRKDPVEDAPGE